MALKAFAMWSTFPLIRKTLRGVCASSPWEARLGREEFGGEVHSFSAAFKESDVVELLSISNHLVFNSFNQLEHFRPLWEKEQGRVSVGLRVNPEHSEVDTELYDPCAPNSRLGIRRSEFDDRSLKGVEGLHFHTLCEQLLEPLERTVEVFEEKFGEFLPQMKWLNLGGGHHITREGYNIDGLVGLVQYLRNKYDVEVYLEPGEAVAIGTGLLVGALTLGSAMPHLLKVVGDIGEWKVVLYVGAGLAAIGGSITALFVREGPYGVAAPPFDLKAAATILRQPAVNLVNLGYLSKSNILDFQDLKIKSHARLPFTR